MSRYPQPAVANGSQALGGAPAALGDGVRGGFTSRADGNLADHVGDDPQRVAANRDGLRAAFGADRLVFARQVHGRDVAVVADAAPVGDADALVTARPGVAVGVLVADCLPVLFADPVAGVVAAAHAGRRGLAAGILAATLDAMTGLGARPGRVRAVIGPAVCGACYEVPAAMRDEVAALVPDSHATTAAGTPALDLGAGAARLLADAGVAVYRHDRCTVEDRRLFSYRRDGRTGRFAGVVLRTR